jgi:hypothetical protein
MGCEVHPERIFRGVDTKSIPHNMYFSLLDYFHPAPKTPLSNERNVTFAI